MLTIRLAEKEEYEKVRTFYHSLIAAMEGAEYSPGWEKEIYPSNEYIRDSIDQGQLYIGLMADQITSAMIVNHECNEGYHGVKWPVAAEKEEVTVVHALGVHSDYCGRGFGKELVKKVISIAKETGQKVVRLDVLEGNVPAERLYTGMGFLYIDALEMFYEDTGWTNYMLYEYRIEE